MKGTTLWTIAALAAIVQVGGCKSADEENAPAIVPKAVSFEGKVDPAYVGVWQTEDGKSVMDMAKDGGVKIQTITRSVAGKSTDHVDGQWLADRNNLLVRCTVGSQPAAVVKYEALLSGSTLTLSQAGGKIKTIYHRR